MPKSWPWEYSVRPPVDQARPTVGTERHRVPSSVGAIARYHTVFGALGEYEKGTIDVIKYSTSGKTDDEGLYDVQRMGGGGAVSYGRGKFETGSDGRYGFRTVRPVSYSIPTDGPVGVLLRATGRSPMRPAHIHMIVAAPGFAPVTTHLFVAGDPYLDSDAVFAVKQSLVVDFTSQPPGTGPDGRDSPTSFCAATFDFKLVRRLP